MFDFIQTLIGKEDNNDLLVYGTKLSLSTNDKEWERHSQRLTEDTKRVDKKNLQLMYLRDDICYNGVNKLTRLVMSTDMFWDCRDEDGNIVKEDVDYMNEWAENTNFWLKSFETIKNTLIFGIGWQEILYAKDGDKKINVGVDVVDPKTMDFGRDMTGNILYDSFGKPQYYVQTVPQSYNVPRNREVENSSYSYGKKQRFERDELAYYTFDNFGGSVDGIGVIEPQYDIVRRKKSLEKANIQSAMLRGNPRYHVKLGSEKYRPTPNERKRLQDQLAALKPQDDIVTEWWVDVKMLNGDVVSEVSDILKYYVERQASCMGIPLAYVSEGGEATNRATLGDQRILLFKTVETYRRRYSSTFTEQVLPSILENRVFSSIPKLVWEPLSLDDKESKSIRLQRYAKTGLITPSKEVEEVVRKDENLPPTRRE